MHWSAATPRCRGQIDGLIAPPPATNGNCDHRIISSWGVWNLAVINGFVVKEIIAGISLILALTQIPRGSVQVQSASRRLQCAEQ